MICWTIFVAGQGVAFFLVSVVPSQFPIGSYTIACFIERSTTDGRQNFLVFFLVLLRYTALEHDDRKYEKMKWKDFGKLAYLIACLY